MLRFKFRHIHPDDPAAASSSERSGTSCIIEDESGSIFGTGDSFLHPGDNFSRPLGRKLAAGRAIRHAITRLGRRDTAGAEKRRDAWEQLFSQSPNTFRGGSV